LNRYLLDTNVCVEILRGRGERAIDRAQKAEWAGLSSIVLAELMFGAEHSSDPDRNRMQVVQWSAAYPIVPFEDTAARSYGAVREYLARRGQLISAMDMLIAAHAIALDAIVVTNNLREFERVDGLRVEDWT